MSDELTFSKDFLVYDALTDEPYSYPKAYVDILGNHASALVWAHVMEKAKILGETDFHEDFIEEFEVGENEAAEYLNLQRSDVARGLNDLMEIKVLKKIRDACASKLYPSDHAFYTVDFEVYSDLLAKRQNMVLTEGQYVCEKK